jgi:hypothetical protein
LAFCAAFGTLRFLKLLRFNKKIIIYMIAFKKSLGELLSFGVIFVILWMSMVQTFYLIFNNYLTEFSTIIKSMSTCFEMILGKFAIQRLIDANGLFGTTLFFTYNILIVFVLINIFLTILIDNYNEVKADSSFLDDQDPDLYEYLKSLFYSFVPKKIGLHNEENKLQHYEYKDSIALFPSKINRLLFKIDKVLYFSYCDFF